MNYKIAETIKVYGINNRLCVCQVLCQYDNLTIFFGILTTGSKGTASLLLHSSIRNDFKVKVCKLEYMYIVRNP